MNPFTHTLCAERRWGPSSLHKEENDEHLRLDEFENTSTAIISPFCPPRLEHIICALLDFFWIFQRCTHKTSKFDGSFVEVCSLCPFYCPWHGSFFCLHLTWDNIPSIAMVRVCVILVRFPVSYILGERLSAEAIGRRTNKVLHSFCCLSHDA